MVAMRILGGDVFINIERSERDDSDTETRKRAFKTVEPCEWALVAPCLSAVRYNPE
jgi:hypothetical protein